MGRAAAAVRTGLAERVAAFMEERHPDTGAAGGWTVAEDHRDGTAVVVWRPGTDRALPAGVRGVVLWRWLWSLRSAGFVAVARTDMEVFGRPGEEADGGVAHWLHVTGWSATGRTPPLPPAPAPPPGAPHVDIPITGRRAADLRCALSGAYPTEIRITYRDSGPHIVATYVTREHGAWGQVVPVPPPWLQRLVDAHRPAGGEGR